MFLSRTVFVNCLQPNNCRDEEVISDIGTRIGSFKVCTQLYIQYSSILIIILIYQQFNPIIYTLYRIERTKRHHQNACVQEIPVHARKAIVPYSVLEIR